jgi:type VI secretion system ImpC/EvpB family protein
MPGRLEFDLSLSPKARPGIPKRGAMRLLLVGDFSGLPAAQRPLLGQRPTHRVDIDNVDACMQRLSVGLPFGDGRLAFQSLDDFHPDSLHGRLPAAAPVAAPAPVSAPAEPAAPSTTLPASAADDGRADLLARLLGGGAAPAPPAAQAALGGLDALIRQIVAPQAVAGNAPAQAAAQAAADADAAVRLRAALHAPAFQALEAHWRGLHWLVSQLELDEQLQLHLFDVTQDEWLDDLVAAGGQVAQTQLFQALVQRGRDQADAAGPTALVGLWTFGASVQDIGMLAGLGQLAMQAGAPLLAGADLALAGDDGTALAGWQALRRSAVAPWIGLAAPGLLLRQPYGPRSDPVQAFNFEEFPGGVPQPGQCLWGCAALAPALLLARAYSASGWDFRPGDDPQIDGLPAVTWRQDGEAQLLPVAWPALDEAGVQRLQRAGLMPLWAHRHQPVLRLACWQSVAESGQPVAGLPAG